MTSPVGSLATEAALLLDAVAARLQTLDMTRAETASPPPGGCPQCGHDPSLTEACTACPLCRFLAVVRGERPETTARFVEGALTVVQALRAMLPAPPDAGPGGSSGTGGSSGPGASREDRGSREDRESREDRGSSDDDGGTGGAVRPAPGTPDLDDIADADPNAVRPIPRATPDPPSRSAPGALERIIVR